MRKNCTNVRTSDCVPVSSFIPSLCNLYKQKSSISSVSSVLSRLCNQVYEPVAVKEIYGVTYEYDPDYLTHVHSVSFTENGKQVIIFEQDKDFNLKVHSYMMCENGDLKGTSTVKSRNTWLIRDYDYFVSTDHTLCVLFNSEEQAHTRDHRRRRKRGYGSGGKICISLCKFDLDVTLEKSPAYNFHPNVYILCLDNEREEDGYSGFWKFQHTFAFTKNNLICVASLGNLINQMEESSSSKRSGKNILLLDFLSIESDTNYRIKHLFQRDLSSQIAESFPNFSSTNEPTILFNSTGTMLLFIKHSIVYSIPDGKLSCIQTNSLSEPHWVTDCEDGEVIVNISQSFFGDDVDVSVEIFKQSKGTGPYEIYRKFTMKQILNTDFGCFYCHNICNGSVKMFIEEKGADRKLLVVDPFKMKIVTKLSLIKKPKDAHIMNVLVNGNEVVVVMRESLHDTDKEVLAIYKLNWHRICSLKYLASCAALKCYSFNELKTMNLPKVIESYLEFL